MPTSLSHTNTFATINLYLCEFGTKNCTITNINNRVSAKLLEQKHHLKDPIRLCTCTVKCGVSWSPSGGGDAAPEPTVCS